MNILRKIYDKITTVVYPEGLKCIACSKEIDSEENKFCLCNSCFKKVNKISGKICLKCGEPLFSEARYCIRCKHTTFNFAQAFSYCYYTGLMKKLIQDFKFEGKVYHSKTFAYMLYVTYLMEILPKYHIDCVTYVPIHISRLKERGYNQCEILANDFCKLSKLNFYKNLLIKTKKTKQQVGLNMKDRKVNLSKAFEITDKNIITDKTVLLIDDIFTTGSTCDECASVLMKNGAYKVVVLTVAHTQLNKAVIKVNKKWKLLRLFQTKVLRTHT